MFKFFQLKFPKSYQILHEYPIWLQSGTVSWIADAHASDWNYFIAVWPTQMATQIHTIIKQIFSS